MSCPWLRRAAAIQHRSGCKEEPPASVFVRGSMGLHLQALRGCSGWHVCRPAAAHGGVACAWGVGWVGGLRMHMHTQQMQHCNQG